METFTRLFVYHSFDRVVINGYLSGCPGQLRWRISFTTWSEYACFQRSTEER